jgi:hypothetical protein
VAETGEVEIELGPVEYLRDGAERALLAPDVRINYGFTATEFGILMPGINDEHGTEAVLNGIVSQRWDLGTVHLNAQLELTREQYADHFLDAIIEGPHDWVVRPVSEIFYERDVGLFRTRSALIGAIWQVQDNIAVDLGLRGAHVNDHTVGEIRAGATFAFGVTKGPDILSRLIATMLHGVH